MRKLCLTLCLVFVFFSLLGVSVSAAAAEYDLNLQVGDVLEPGRYKFIDVLVPGSGHPNTADGSYAIYFDFVSNRREFGHLVLSYTDVDTFRLLFYQPGSVVSYTVSDGWTYPYNVIDIYEPFTVSNPLEAQFFTANLKLLYRFGHDESFVGFFSGLVDLVSDFFVSSLSTLSTLFFVDGDFTFFGVLSVMAVSISISILLFYIFLRFLRFRG